ncbi:MAG: DNA repair protein RecO [Vulcanimicrobiaceae bacterium]
MNRRVYRARALVLRARNLGEADRIYTLFSDVRGKLDAVGKGVRRTTSRIGGRLELGSEVQLELHRGRSLDVIASADALANHWEGLVAPEAFATAHVVVESLDAFCEPDLALPDVYALARGAFAALASRDEPRAILPRFSLRLLALLGVGPELEACVHCAGPLASAWGDPEAGGLLCERCRPHGLEAAALDPADVENLRALAAPRTSGGMAALAARPAAARFAETFVAYQLGKRSKAARVLEELAR